MNNKTSYKPLIIIGAPRSGTNMLRDVLCRLDGVGTWPCDEINYIWRHGNVRHPTDELSAEQARPEVANYIRRKFQQLADDHGYQHLVEKTCANSLRVPFVDQVVADANYLFIVRNGFDALASAGLRWKAPLDLAYLLGKARFVPFTDLPYYASRYLANRLYRRFSGQGRLAYWGPQFAGIDERLDQLNLLQVCALQWRRCIELAQEGLDVIPRQRVFQIKYEDFVAAPRPTLENICSWQGIATDPESLAAAVKTVSTSSLGKGRNSLQAEDYEAVVKIIGPTLRQLDYELD